MTDYPRFEPVSCRPEEAHRRYHGGCFVDLVFGVVDYRALRRPTGRAPHTLKFEVGVLIALVLLFITLVCLDTAHSQRVQQPAAAQMVLAIRIERDLSDENFNANWRRPLAAYLHAPYTP